ncbi:lipopolysaccharide/colanic/teichoic acid biosynthesis glycosyltransferase [Rhizobium pisi]
MSITELNNSISTESFRPSSRQLPSLKMQTPVIHSDAPQAPWMDLALKRAFDIVSSLSALLVLAPFLLLVALLIKLDSPGPVLFKQTRWGKNCKTIKVYKFRSMRTDLCDASGVAQTVRNDPRITRIGAILRRTNIDELPQLLNVLLGDMSVVGPRCHAIGMRASDMLYEELVPEYHQRHAMRPGMTGLAQMRGLRGPTDRPAKARARIVSDLYYVQNFSIWMDMRIIVGTVVSELTRGKGF